MSDLAWLLHRAWPEDYTLWFSFSVTYDFLATEDINRDRIQDVLFLYKNTNSSNNSNLSCADEGNCFYLKKEELAVGGGILPPFATFEENRWWRFCNPARCPSQQD